MKIFCDDGSTNVKLAWFEGKTLKSAVSVNSFRHNWKHQFRVRLYPWAIRRPHARTCVVIIPALYILCAARIA